MGLTTAAAPDEVPATGEARYRLRAAGGVSMQVFGDEVVAFNPATWNTHLLDRAAAIVLEALERGPLDREAIGALLAGASGDAAEDVAAFADVLLDELVAAQLVEACNVAPAG